MGLAGKRCLLTRPGDSAGATTDIFEQFGAKVRNLSLIETRPTDEFLRVNLLNFLKDFLKD